MAGRPDKWWEIKGNTRAEALSIEVFDLILSEGAPYIMRYLDSDQLAALWKVRKIARPYRDATGEVPGEN